MQAADEDPELLWLWCRPAATASNRPLTCAPPCAACVALKRFFFFKRTTTYLPVLAMSQYTGGSKNITDNTTMFLF